MRTPGQALEILRGSASLTAVCRNRGVILLTAFGSAIKPNGMPHDLDLGVLFEYGGPRDLLGLLDDLVVMTDCDFLDVTVLNDAGPVIRERALVGAEVLFEARRSIHANASISAMLERMDTAWMRALIVEELAR